MGRSPCCEKAHTNKGAWTREEDERLTAHIQVHGAGCWRSLPKAAGLLRCGKSCRLRWINYLRPDLKRGNFTDEDDDLIIKFHSLLGNKWSVIASRLPGRTDNEIKNYWNTHLRRKLLNKGIDPSTHRPINDDESTLHNTNTAIDAELKEQKITETCWCKTEDMLDGLEESHELNLDLRICPPSENPPESLQRGGRKLICFSGNRGLKSWADCRCNTTNNDWFKLM